MDKTTNTEQFNQITEAIIAGKYSWACVLFLRSAGYNPVDYIPYRTYNRLLKENCQLSEPSRAGDFKLRLPANRHASPAT